MNEITPKKWKLHQLLGGALFVLAVVALVVGASWSVQAGMPKQNPLTIAAAAGMVGGLLYFFGACLGAWWHHG